MREKTTQIRCSLRAKAVIDEEAKEKQMTTAKYLNSVFLKEADNGNRLDHSTPKN